MTGEFKDHLMLQESAQVVITAQQVPMITYRIFASQVTTVLSALHQ